MKKFIIRLLQFFAFFVIAGILVVTGHYIILNSNDYWKLPNNIQYLVIGHSHPECAFDDTLIPGMVNLASSGESYFYTYSKLKKIISNNKQLKAVLIEFGNDNVTTKMDYWTWSDEYIRYNLPKYFAIIGPPEFTLLWKNNLKSILTIPPKRYIEEIGYNYYNVLVARKAVLSGKRTYGGYKYLDVNKTDSLIQALETANGANRAVPTKPQISEVNIYYLQKILDLCEQNRLNIYLIRSPVHESYVNTEEEKAFKAILKNNFADAKFLDFHNFPFKNNEYADLAHLNYHGAKKFSVWFSNLLRNDLLEKEMPQVFIEEEIQKVN